MSEWKPYPKSEPKPKKDRKQQWYAMQKRSLEKRKLKMKPTQEKDAKFYKYVWENSEHFCSECGRELFHPKEGDARNFIHHILPKATHPYFRHEIRNVILLCWSDHQKAESAISFPKMTIYPYCQTIKTELMNRFTNSSNNS